MKYYEYEQQYFYEKEHGPVRLKAIRNAIDAAVTANDKEPAMMLYYQFINEDIFHGNNYQATIIFPEYLAYFEKYPELEKEYQHDIMWTYKWIISNFYLFPQISLKQIKNIFDKYADMCRRFHFSLRTYYNNLSHFIANDMEPDQTFCGMTAKEAHYRMLKSRNDSLSDCQACQLDDEAEYLLFVEKDIESALKTAKPLFEGKKKCAEVPHITYAKFAYYYFENGDIKNASVNAAKAHRLINRRYGNDGGLLVYKALCTLITAYTDPEKAYKMLKKILPYVENNPNGRQCFQVFRAGYQTMLCLENNGKTKVRIKLPFKNEEIYRENNVYDVIQLKNWMYDKAKEYAEKFDNRNGNTIFQNILDQKYLFDLSEIEMPEELNVPVLEYIEENIVDGTLSEGFSLPRKKSDDEPVFADGAKDGIMLYHTQSDPQSYDEMNEILLLAGSGESAKAVRKTEKFLIKNKVSALSIIDSIQRFIYENTDQLDPNEIFRFGVDLVIGSKNYEAVKIGLSILEIFSDYNEHLLEAIMELSSCDEFTLFCIWAVRKLENGNDLIFRMAKNTSGWGKIFAVNNLEADTDEIREWLFNEGIKNSVYPGYLAIKCFDESIARSLLENGMTDEQLTTMGIIVLYLVLDGPTIGIQAFDDGENILHQYLEHAEKADLRKIDREILADLGENCEFQSVKLRCEQILSKYPQE